MFYQRDGLWEVFPRKITYKEKKEMYDLTLEAYENNPNYTFVTVEDVVLSQAETERLHLVKNVESASIEDIRKYVIEGIETEQTKGTIEINKMKKQIEEMQDIQDTFL